MINRYQNRIRNKERGAALVEAAIIIPILVFLTLASVEAAYAWQVRADLDSGVRTGALQVSRGVGVEGSDLEALQAILEEIGPENVGQFGRVIFYEVDPHPGLGTTPATALDSGAATLAQCQAEVYPSVGVQDLCVIYNPDFLALLVRDGHKPFFREGRFSTNYSQNYTGTHLRASDVCQPTRVFDQRWCAAARGGWQAANPGEGYSERIVGGHVGIVVEYQHEWLTGILPFGAPLFTSEVSISGVGQFN